MKRALAVIVAALIVGCGDEQETVRNAGDDGVSEQAIIDALKLGVDENLNGLPDRPGAPGENGYVTQTGCTVSVLLTSRDMVETYADAGDPVATNPDGTVGVKFVDERNCGEQLADALTTLP